VIRRFLSGVRRPAQRRQLVATAEKLLDSDAHRAPEEQAWLKELHDSIAENSGGFLLDGLRSVLRIGSVSAAGLDSGRESHFHDFIHNRVLFRLRRRIGAAILERETTPDRIKELTLCAAFLARVGYVDENFLPQEKQFIEKLLGDVWGISPSLAEAVCEIAMETAIGNIFFACYRKPKPPCRAISAKPWSKLYSPSR
jgi:hypothetical protein